MDTIHTIRGMISEKLPYSAELPRTISFSITYLQNNYSDEFGELWSCYIDNYKDKDIEDFNWAYYFGWFYFKNEEDLFLFKLKEL